MQELMRINRKMKGFVGYIIAATMINPFALFIFVLLVLYAEKIRREERCRLGSNDTQIRGKRCFAYVGMDA